MVGFCSNINTSPNSGYLSTLNDTLVEYFLSYVNVTKGFIPVVKLVHWSRSALRIFRAILGITLLYD